MNQSGRMDKVREALDALAEYGNRNNTAVAAALAEVEEWETRLGRTRSLVTSVIARAETAEDEADRLKAEFSTRTYHYEDRIAELEGAVRNYLTSGYEPGLRAALAPADRNTT